MIQKHIIINLIVSLIFLFFVEPLFVLIIFLSSILIDFDHYIYYIFEKKRFYIKSAFNWYILEKNRFHKLSQEEKKKHRYFIFVFHGLEILLILFLLSIHFKYFLFVFIGFSIHLAEDAAEAFKFKYLSRKLFLSYAIYLHIKNKVK